MARHNQTLATELACEWGWWAALALLSVILHPNDQSFNDRPLSHEDQLLSERQNSAKTKILMSKTDTQTRFKFQLYLPAMWHWVTNLTPLSSPFIN
jgi:hypothetical protein